MSKRKTPPRASPGKPVKTAAGRPSCLLDTRVIYCGDNLQQLAKPPDKCVDLIYIDPPFNPGRATSRAATPSGPRPRRVSRVNSNRNYEVFWGDMTEPRPSGSSTRACFNDRHASTPALDKNVKGRR